VSKHLAALRSTPPPAERSLPFLSVPVKVGAMGSGKDWNALAQAIKRRRVNLGYQRQKSLADRLPFGARLLGELENGRRDTYDAATIAALENALLWGPGSTEAILDGGRPYELPIPTPGLTPLAAKGAAELVAEINERITELARRVPPEVRPRPPADFVVFDDSEGPADSEGLDGSFGIVVDTDVHDRLEG